MFCHSWYSWKTGLLNDWIEVDIAEHVLQRILDNSLLIAGVKTIGLKLLEECECSTTALPICLKTATFQFEGMFFSERMLLKRSMSAGTREGDF